MLTPQQYLAQIDQTLHAILNHTPVDRTVFHLAEKAHADIHELATQLSDDVEIQASLRVMQLGLAAQLSTSH